MSGFVDVGGMTLADVKRMGHTDELGPGDQGYRRPARQAPVTVPTDLAFTAAVTAYRIQGQRYNKNTLSYDEQGQPVTNRTNREIAAEVLTNQGLITEQDREQAVEMRRYYQGLQFKILAGKVLGDIDAKALAFASGDTVTDRDLGLICYLPDGYARAQKRQSIDERIADARGGFVGAVGTKVQCTIEVLRSNYSQQWGCYFITAITDKDQPLFFSNKRDLRAGSTVRIQGNVKAHRDNQTQLNYVKIV